MAALSSHLGSLCVPLFPIKEGEEQREEVGFNFLPQSSVPFVVWVSSGVGAGSHALPTAANGVS